MGKVCLAVGKKRLNIKDNKQNCGALCCEFVGGYWETNASFRYPATSTGRFTGTGKFIF